MVMDSASVSSCHTKNVKYNIYPSSKITSDSNLFYIVGLNTYLIFTNGDIKPNFFKPSGDLGF